MTTSTITRFHGHLALRVFVRDMYVHSRRRKRFTAPGAGPYYAEALGGFRLNTR